MSDKHPMTLLARDNARLRTALQKAIDLISIPASRHEPDPPGLTGQPRYSAGLIRHHAECAALLPVLKAALIGMRLKTEEKP